MRRLLLVGSLVLLGGCSFQMSEVAEVTARDATQSTGSQVPTTGDVVYTKCEAHVEYTVDGQTQRAQDAAMLVLPGQPAENCPFEVGQSAVVWVGSSPDNTRVFTTSGRSWWLWGGLFLLPLLVGFRLLRGRTAKE